MTADKKNPLFQTKLLDGKELVVTGPLMPLEGYRGSYQYMILMKHPGSPTLTGVCKVDETGNILTWYVPEEKREGISEALKDLGKTLTIDRVMNS